MTIEEVKEAAKNDSTLINGLITIVQESEEGKTLLSNHAKAHFDENIGARVSEIYSQIDNDLFEILGERKTDTQKTYDFVKAKASQLKELVDNGGDSAEKVKELNDKIKLLEKNSGNDKFWKDTHEKAVGEWGTKEKEFEDRILELQGNHQNSLVSNDLTMGLSGLKFNPSIPQAAIDAMIANVKNEVTLNSKIEDGKVVYLDTDKKPMLDDKYSPITANGIFKQKLADILEQGTPGGGAKVGKKGTIQTVGTGDNVTKKLVLDAKAFSTKVGFQKIASEALVEQGIQRGSKEWNNLIDGAAAEYKVSTMNRS